jgi:hypothetical protein
MKIIKRKTFIFPSKYRLSAQLISHLRHHYYYYYNNFYDAYIIVLLLLLFKTFRSIINFILLDSIRKKRKEKKNVV